jgi:hypothetical protein
MKIEITKLTSFRPICGSKPCNECPFRHKAMPGWLGAATPESFIIEISYEHPLPCHPTIDYDDKRWLQKWSTQRIGMICAGSLIMAANMGKKFREPGFPSLSRNTRLVFATAQEFLDHHNNALVKSWARS